MEILQKMQKMQHYHLQNHKKPPAVAANPLGDRQARRRLFRVVLLLLH